MTDCTQGAGWAAWRAGGSAAVTGQGSEVWGGCGVAALLWWAWGVDEAGGSLLRAHHAPLPPSRLIPKLGVPWGFPGGWGICAHPM